MRSRSIAYGLGPLVHLKYGAVSESVDWMKRPVAVGRLAVDLSLSSLSLSFLRRGVSKRSARRRRRQRRGQSPTRGPPRTARAVKGRTSIRASGWSLQLTCTASSSFLALLYTLQRSSRQTHTSPSSKPPSSESPTHIICEEDVKLAILLPKSRRI